MSNPQQQAIQHKSPEPVGATYPGAKPSAPMPSPLLLLQQALGNRGVGRFLQAKLSINQPGDAYEQEADRVADAVMRLSDVDIPGLARAPKQLQRSCGGCSGQEPCPECANKDEELREPENAPVIQRYADPIRRERTEASHTEIEVPAIKHPIDRLHGGGQPLPETERSFFQWRFARDFSQVRIHADDTAASCARMINAQAFTMGHNIVFAGGRYAPTTFEGRRLLAHELTHVAQQGSAGRLGFQTATYPQLSHNSAPRLQRQADISQLPPGLPCVAVQGPGHPAGTDLSFPGGGTTLTPADIAAIGAFFATWTAAGGTSDISVDGFASNVGSQRDNWQTSCDRAEAVKSELVSRGVPNKKITTFAHGASTEYGATAPPNRRAVLHLTGLLSPADLTIDRARQGGDADSIFFDRGVSTVTEPSQLSKIAPLASAGPAAPLTLFGFVSEDENVPAATGTALATARIADVSTRLGGAGHTGARTPDVTQTGFGAGQIDYRGMRKVKVRAAGASSGVLNCAAGATVACSPPARFTDAQTRANALLTPVIAALGPPVSAAASPLLDQRFGSTAATRASVAALVKANLTDLQPHITGQMTPVSVPGPPPALTPGPGHRCANACDANCAGTTVAYNSDVDASAVMTLCDTPSGFMQQPDQDKRAGTLIHEGLHGITIRTGPIPPAVGPPITADGADDFSYKQQRLINFIDPRTAVKNNDSYLLFVLQLNGLPVTIGRTGASVDVATGSAMVPVQRLEVDRALAWLEGWLIWAEQEISSLYDTIGESTAAGSWTSPYYETSMGLVAPRFGFTIPPALPSQAEKFAIAAIHERLKRMSGTLYNTNALTITRLTPGTTAWSPGPAFTVTIGDDFFAFPAPGRARAQLELLLAKIIGATTGVSADAASRYADLVNQVRLHRGGGAP